MSICAIHHFDTNLFVRLGICSEGSRLQANNRAVILPTVPIEQVMEIGDAKNRNCSKGQRIQT